MHRAEEQLTLQRLLSCVFERHKQFPLAFASAYRGFPLLRSYELWSKRRLGGGLFWLSVANNPLAKEAAKRQRDRIKERVKRADLRALKSG